VPTAAKCAFARVPGGGGVRPITLRSQHNSLKKQENCVLHCGGV
jgi:hypothetical protein